MNSQFSTRSPGSISSGGSASIACASDPDSMNVPASCNSSTNAIWG
ncbi:hypothetical protein [Deinococcus hohokamensis]|uniref:Uncharacterized protein n=1 Tax=Deinococcus hohokamensis TaxID=309883 RepID=A0ABV9ID80_9DEIO